MAEQTSNVVPLRPLRVIAGGKSSGYDWRNPPRVHVVICTAERMAIGLAPGHERLAAEAILLSRGWRTSDKHVIPDLARLIAAYRDGDRATAQRLADAVLDGMGDTRKPPAVIDTLNPAPGLGIHCAWENEQADKARAKLAKLLSKTRERNPLPKPSHLRKQLMSAAKRFTTQEELNHNTQAALLIARFHEQAAALLETAEELASVMSKGKPEAVRVAQWRSS
jgi:hypothetical protein